jgi:hypothetical protein
LQHNVVLIRELNQNIARIVHLYKELSARCAAPAWHSALADSSVQLYCKVSPKRDCTSRAKHVIAKNTVLSLS